MLGLGSGLSMGNALDSEFLISSVSDIEVWLKFNTGQTTTDSDSDGDADTQWADQSGNGNNATSSHNNDAHEGSFSGGAWTPSSAGLGTGSGILAFLALDSTVSLADDFTVIMVLTQDNTSDTLIGDGTGSNLIRFGQGSTSGFRIKAGGLADDIAMTQAASTDKAMFRFTRDGSDNISVHQNQTTVLIAPETTTANALAISKMPHGSSGLLAAEYVYEVAIFNKVLTGSELVSVEVDILDRNSLSAD